MAYQPINHGSAPGDGTGESGAPGASLDGAKLDATAANHSPGAGFYNTNAAFKAGIGAYVMGAADWVRIAA